MDRREVFHLALYTLAIAGIATFMRVHSVAVSTPLLIIFALMAMLPPIAVMHFLPTQTSGLDESENSNITGALSQLLPGTGGLVGVAVILLSTKRPTERYVLDTVLLFIAMAVSFALFGLVPFGGDLPDDRRLLINYRHRIMSTLMAGAFYASGILYMALRPV